MRVPVLRLMTTAILGALALPLAAQEWTGTGRVQGTVTSADGTALSGATVRFQLLDDRSIAPPPLTTDARGAFTVVGVRGGNWVVRADAQASYADVVLANVADSRVSPPVDLVLQPVPPNERDSKVRLRAYQALAKGDELATAGRLAAARDQYRKALDELEPSARGVALAAIAITYVEARKLDEARKLFERALERDPSQRISLKALAAIMAGRGQAKRAERALDALSPDERVAITTLIGIAVTHYNRGRPEAAKPWLDRAIVEDPSASEPYYFRGLVNLSLGDTSAARSDLEVYVKREPDGRHVPDAEEYLGYLEVNAGRD